MDETARREMVEAPRGGPGGESCFVLISRGGQW